MPGPSSYAIVARWDSRQVKAVLSALEPKHWRFAEALTLTRVAQHVKTDERQAMQSDFDRPTPFTLNALRLQRATRERLEARVWFKDPPRMSELEHYLLPQVHGGERRLKRFEAHLQRAGYLPRGHALVPASGAPLDAYGNVRRGLYTRILADLNASPVGANTNAKSRRRRRNNGLFFYGDPGGRARGIWMRAGGGGKAGFGFRFGKKVILVFLEVSRMPRYKRRFHFFDIAEHTVERTYGAAFDQAAQQTLRSIRP